MIYKSKEWFLFLCQTAGSLPYIGNCTSLPVLDSPDFMRKPMAQVASVHETGASSFLGSTVPAGLSGAEALKMALDIIFAHTNVAPFISRQLIQRLVTSNPLPAYVARVTAVFNNDGNGVKGNLKAVVKAILLDDEARNKSNISNPQFGKVREPIMRFLAWARAFNANSAADTWGIGDTSDPAKKLGQSPSRSPTAYTGRMFGWRSFATDFASRWQRSSTRRVAKTSWRIALTATSRSSRRSTAT